MRADLTVPADCRRAQFRIVRRARPLLGTFVEITVYDVGQTELPHVIEDAFAAITRVHARMSPSAPDSDLSRLRRAERGRALVVDPWSWSVLASALELAEWTKGLFDPTLTAPSRCAGCWRDIEVLPGHRIRLHRSVPLDLGGIAKGFAVDRAIDVLRAAGVRSAVVNAGGDLRVIGTHSAPAVLRDPFRPDRFFQIGGLADAALATSSNAFDAPGAGRLRRRDGRRLWIGRGSVSVCAPTCMAADALCKVVAAIGPASAAGYLDRCGATAIGITRRGLVQSAEVKHAA